MSILLFVASVSLSLFSQSEILDRVLQYRPGDWISYPVLRYGLCMEMDLHYVYVGTTNGIARFDFRQKTWDTPITRSNGLSGDSVFLLAYDGNSGFLWVVTENGLDYQLPSSQQWRHLSYENLRVKSIAGIGLGKEWLWMDTPQGLFCTRHGEETFVLSNPTEMEKDSVVWRTRKNSPDPVFPQFFMEEGYLFFPQGYIQDTHLRQFRVTAWLEDHFRNLFLTTQGLGTGLADLNTFWLRLFPYGPFVSDLWAIEKDASKIWIGGFSFKDGTNAITEWDWDTGKWKYFEFPYVFGLKNCDVTCILADTGAVWFGTMGGLVRYDKRNQTWETVTVHSNLWNDQILSLELEDTLLWVGTASGLNAVLLPHRIVEKIHSEILDFRKISDMVYDGHTLWLATDRGVVRRIEKGWVYESGYSGMLSNSASAISAWKNEVWIATDEGVEMYSYTTDQWIGFPKNQYPTHGPIYAIAVDSDVVWFGTEYGVLKYIKSENRWRRFTTEDGLLHNSVRDILLDGDFVWFATAKGLTRFYWNAPYRTD